MVMEIRHLALFNIACHAVQHGSQRKGLIFAWNRILVIQIGLHIVMLHQEIQHFIGRFFVLAFLRQAELQVNAGV